MSSEIWDIKIRTFINTDEPETEAAFDRLSAGIDLLLENFARTQQKLGLPTIGATRVMP